MEIEATELELTPEYIAAEEAWEAGAYQRELDAVTIARQSAYQSTSDPIMAQWLRKEATEQEWLDAVQAVKDANPYPVKEESPITEENTVDADIALE